MSKDIYDDRSFADRASDVIINIGDFIEEHVIISGIIIFIILCLLCIILWTVLVNAISSYNTNAVSHEQQEISENLPNMIREAEAEHKGIVKVQQLDDGTEIFIDVNTGVQYIAHYRYGIAAMVNTDGTPLINKTWQELHTNDNVNDASNASSSDTNSSSSDNQSDNTANKADSSGSESGTDANTATSQ